MSRKEELELKLRALKTRLKDINRLISDYEEELSEINNEKLITLNNAINVIRFVCATHTCTECPNRSNCDVSPMLWENVK